MNKKFKEQASKKYKAISCRKGKKKRVVRFLVMSVLFLALVASVKWHKISLLWWGGLQFWTPKGLL